MGKPTIMSILFHRQLGHKSLSSLTSSSEQVGASEDNAGCNGISASSSAGGGGGVSKLVPLVQGLSHQVHLFLGKFSNILDVEI